MRTHLLPNMTVDDEMEMLKRAGVTSVAIMSVPPQNLLQLSKSYPGYVIPFVGFARSLTSTLLPLNADTIASFGKLLDSGAICGFG